MPMNVAAAGKLTSKAEVTDVVASGFWLRVHSEELFVPFSSFPWFRDATMAQIRNVELPTAQHLFWPDLDIDLSVDSIRDPGAFPLVSKGGA
jgi:hypothetical protein